MNDNILFVETSPRGEASISRSLSRRFREELRTAGYRGGMMETDLATDPPPFVNQAWIKAAFTPAADRSAADRNTLSASDSYIEQVQAADAIVISAPMHNYGMPAPLKAWVDQVVRIGETFSFDLARGDFPLEPILSGKRMLVLSSRGEFGFVGGVRADMNHLDPHLATVARYLGVADSAIETVAVEYQEFKDERHDRSLEQAYAALPGIAARWV